jgi:hypothetical protein
MTGSVPTKEDGYMDLRGDFKLGMRQCSLRDSTSMSQQ